MSWPAKIATEGKPPFWAVWNLRFSRCTNVVERDFPLASRILRPTQTQSALPGATHRVLCRRAHRTQTLTECYTRRHFVAIDITNKTLKNTPKNIILPSPIVCIFGTHIYKTHTCTHIRVHTCACICIYIYIYKTIRTVYENLKSATGLKYNVCVYIYIYIYITIRTVYGHLKSATGLECNVCACVLCMCIHVECKNSHIHMYMYIYIYIYTHTHKCDCPF